MPLVTVCSTAAVSASENGAVRCLVSGGAPARAKTQTMGGPRDTEAPCSRACPRHPGWLRPPAAQRPTARRQHRLVSTCALCAHPQLKHPTPAHDGRRRRCGHCGCYVEAPMRGCHRALSAWDWPCHSQPTQCWRFRHFRRSCYGCGYGVQPRSCWGCLCLKSATRPRPRRHL